MPLPSSPRPKVSVAMITYNHEKCIAQAIESVLMQETTFPIELVIGEDYSTDNTREIVKRYAALRPDVIQPLLHERNVGMRGNGDAVLEACRGQYIACLEGDDYWTSPQKLQRQVDFLDQHPDYSICGHRFMNVFSDHPEWPPSASPVQKESGTLRDILRWNYLLTCTVMYRAGLVTGIPTPFKRLRHGDMPLWVLLAQRGRVGFINEIMGAYRLHRGGVWIGASIDAQIAALEETINAIHDYLGDDYSRLRRISLCIRYVEFANKCLGNKDSGKARRLLLRALLKSPTTFCTSAEARTSLKMLGRSGVLDPVAKGLDRGRQQYYQARIWAGAKRRSVLKTIRGRPGSGGNGPG